MGMNVNDSAAGVSEPVEQAADIAFGHGGAAERALCVAMRKRHLNVDHQQRDVRGINLFALSSHSFFANRRYTRLDIAP